MPFLGQGQYVKMLVFRKRQLNFEGSVGSQNQLFLEPFSRGVKSAYLEGTFGDFCDFWVPPGIQMGSTFHQKCVFLRSEILMLFGFLPGGRGGTPLECT